MPVLEISSNTTIPNKKEAAIKASKLVASLLGKLENVFPVKRLLMIVDDCPYQRRTSHFVCGDF
jgi:hypothetical protein